MTDTARMRLLSVSAIHKSPSISSAKAGDIASTRMHSCAHAAGNVASCRATRAKAAVHAAMRSGRWTQHGETVCPAGALRIRPPAQEERGPRHEGLSGCCGSLPWRQVREHCRYLVDVGVAATVAPRLSTIVIHRVHACTSAS